MSDIKVDVNGCMSVLEPKNKRSYTLKELQGHVGGLTKLVPTGTGKYIVLNKDGAIKRLRSNDLGTMWLMEACVPYVAYGTVLLIDDGRIQDENMYQ